MDAYDLLIDGYRAFRKRYLGDAAEDWRHWAGKPQAPRIMVIGCSDSRVNPAILTHAGLGDLFVVNNIANIVPAFAEGRHTHRSVGAALQYAVTVLKVEHVIVMGHSSCGGVRALMSGIGDIDEATQDDYVAGWIRELEPARAAVLADMPDAPFEEQCQVCELEGVLVSIGNLLTYPFVRSAFDEGRLSLHAWYFMIESGDMLSYDYEKGEYCRLVRPLG